MTLRTGRPLPERYGIGFDERVVEFPWIATRELSGRVLDAGSTLNHAHVLPRLRPRVASLDIVTLTPEEQAFPQLDVSYQYADLRDLPYRDAIYDTVVCLSTLEHVGMDNAQYGDAAPRSDDSLADLARAVRELRRVLRPGGRMFVTVPFGVAADLGWQRVFDAAALEALLAELAPVSSEVEIFRYLPSGWVRSNVDEAGDAVYRDHFSDPTPAADRAPAARARRLPGPALLSARRARVRRSARAGAAARACRGHAHVYVQPALAHKREQDGHRGDEERRHVAVVARPVRRAGDRLGRGLEDDLRARRGELEQLVEAGRPVLAGGRARRRRGPCRTAPAGGRRTRSRGTRRRARGPRGRTRPGRGSSSSRRGSSRRRARARRPGAWPRTTCSRRCSRCRARSGRSGRRGPAAIARHSGRGMSWPAKMSASPSRFFVVMPSPRSMFWYHGPSSVTRGADL